MSDAEATQTLDGFDKIAVDSVNWTMLYRHAVTGQLLEVYYPQSELHGGGPRALRAITAQDASARYDRLGSGDGEGFEPSEG